MIFFAIPKLFDRQMHLKKMKYVYATSFFLSFSWFSTQKHIPLHPQNRNSEPEWWNGRHEGLKIL